MPLNCFKIARHKKSYMRDDKNVGISPLTPDRFNPKNESEDFRRETPIQTSRLHENNDGLIQIDSFSRNLYAEANESCNCHACCSNREYSNTRTQIDDETSSKNCQKYWPKRAEKWKEMSLFSWLRRAFAKTDIHFNSKSSNAKFSFFSRKKPALQCGTPDKNDELYEIPHELLQYYLHNRVGYLDVFSDSYREQNLENNSFDSDIRNGESNTHELSQIIEDVGSKKSSTENHEIVSNGISYDRNSNCTHGPREHFKELSKSDPDAFTVNPITSNFTSGKELLTKHSVVNKLDNKVIFHFNDSESLDYQSDLNSIDSDEVFIRPHKNECLNNGIQITNLSDSSNFSSAILSRNFYQSDEFIYKDPPPSPENVRKKVSFNNAWNTVDANLFNNNFRSRPSQEEFRISPNLQEQNSFIYLEPEIEYQPETSVNEVSTEYSIVPCDSECNIIRSNSHGSSGYHSSDPQSRFMLKQNLRENFESNIPQTETRDFTIGMKEFEPEICTEFKSSQSYSAYSLPKQNLQCDRSKVSNRFKFTHSKSFDPSHNRMFCNKICSSCQRIAEKLQTHRERPDCTMTPGEEYWSSNSSDMDTFKFPKQYFPNERVNFHQQNLTSLKSPSATIKTTKNPSSRVIKKSNSFNPMYSAFQQLNISKKDISDSGLSQRKHQMLYFNGRLCCSCQKPKSSKRKKFHVSPSEESYTVFKYYGFIDGPCCRACSPTRNFHK